MELAQARVPAHRYLEIKGLLQRRRLRFSADVFPRMGNGGAE